MKRNEFELVGRLNYVGVKESAKGKVVRLLISKKGKNDEYLSYPVTFFREKADEIVISYKKGDYVHVIGYLMPQNYTDKNGIERNEMSLLGNDIEFVKYDEDKRDYVAVTPAELANENDEDDCPW